jgi:hypothetical protein
VTQALESLQRLTLLGTLRAGHPFERPIFCSSIPAQTMAAVVTSFLEFGLQGLRPKVGGWTWEELHTINQGISWQSW